MTWSAIDQLKGGQDEQDEASGDSGADGEPAEGVEARGELGRRFAAQKGITAEKFYYWKRRLVGGDRSVRIQRNRFVPVRLEGAWEVAGLLEIVLESGELVRITEGVSAQTLRRAIQVLRERC